MLSPETNLARYESAAQEDMPGLPSAAAVASGMASSSGIRNGGLAMVRSAMEPKGGRETPKKTRRRVVEPAYAVDPGNERQVAGAAVVGAFGERLDDGVQAGGEDADRRLAGLGCGVVELCVARR